MEATGVESRSVDGRDVLAVDAVAQALLAHVREGRPAFLECIVFRVRPHSLSDPDYRYRARDAGADWMQTNDPIERLRLALAPAETAALERIDAEVAAEVAAALAAAEAADQTPLEHALMHRYSTPELDGLA